MKKMIVLGAFLALLFGGCTAKEFGEGAKGITDDISNLFEEGRDKSAD